MAPSLSPSPPTSLTWRDLDGTLFLCYGTLYVLAVDVVLYPADLLTTRMQADRHLNERHVRVLRVIRDIVRREGLAGLYRGFGTLAVGSFPGQLSYYVAYEFSNELLRKAFSYDVEHDSFYPSLLANAAAGMVAEGVSAFSYLPTDIVSQRLQMGRGVDFHRAKFHHKGAIPIIKTVWRNEGVAGFFRGFWPYMIVFGPGSAVWWASYELSKHSIGRLTPHWASGDDFYSQLLLSSNHLISGAFAGVASCVATNPLDVARTRLQLLEYRDPRERANLKGGFLRLLRDVYAKEGIQGLYKGMKPRLYIKIPGSALAFLGYERLKELCINALDN